MDLGSSDTYPSDVESQLGKVVLFGEFLGELNQEGNENGELELLAEECGSVISGTLELESETIELSGKLVGSGLTLEGLRGNVPLTLVGNVYSYELIEGAWFDENGSGGPWSVEFIEGSEPVAPCSVSETILED
jgi:hypothetical protein